MPRYLLNTHNLYCATLGANSEVMDLVGNLLLPDRLPPPLPKENVPNSFDEARPCFQTTAMHTLQPILQTLSLPWLSVIHLGVLFVGFVVPKSLRFELLHAEVYSFQPWCCTREVHRRRTQCKRSDRR